MELVGLTLAIPAVLAANVAYVLAVRFGLARFIWARAWVLGPSYLVILIGIADVALVTTVGAATARGLIGPAFWRLHLLVVLLGAPSLANILILARKGVWFRHWYATVVPCFLCGVFLVFFQVGVGDALFGPDGVGGPYSP